MRIRRTGHYEVQILLSEKELAEMELSYAQIGAAPEQTQALLQKLLSAAQKQFAFPSQGRVIAEFYPAADGGCTVWLSSLTLMREKAVSPVIYAFPDLDLLTEAAKRLFARFAHRIRKSSLYRVPNGWRLVFYPLDIVENITLPFLDEFALRCAQGPLAAAVLNEHADLVLQDDAIDQLVSYFG